MKFTLIVALLPFALYHPTLLRAQEPTDRPAVPAFINYQGFVTDSNNVPLGDLAPSNFDVSIRIYTQSTGGTPLWGERQTATFTEGQFSILVGNGIEIDQSTPSGAALLKSLFGPNGAATSGEAINQLFLGITVNGIGQSDATELVPRQQLVANPFAFRALTADEAEFARTVADGAIGAAALSANSVSGGFGGAIADGSITAIDIAANTVTSDNIAAATITNAELADDAVTNAKLADNAVGSAEITDGSVSTAEIANDSVNGAKVANDSLTAADLAANSVLSSEIGADQNSLATMTSGRFDSQDNFIDANGVVLGSSIVFAGAWNGSFYQLESGGVGAQLVHTSQGRIRRATSSRRYKENIRPLRENFRKILKAEPKVYNRPDDPSLAEIGFIAEEFEELGLGHLVIRDLEGKADALAYDRISIYLLEVIKEQQSSLDAQQARLDSLVDRLASEDAVHTQDQP